MHLRTSVADITRPVLIEDSDGLVAIYGIPYLLPDAVLAELGADRTHESVLSAAAQRIRDDTAARGIGRAVVLAHAFVTGAQGSESERDIRVGGIADVPASVFAGLQLRSPRPSARAAAGQRGQRRAAGPVLGVTAGVLVLRAAARQVGDPGRDRRAPGRSTVTLLATPVPRPLREVRGRLDDLLAPGRR